MERRVVSKKRLSEKELVEVALDELGLEISEID